MNEPSFFRRVQLFCVRSRAHDPGIDNGPSRFIWSNLLLGLIILSLQSTAGLAQAQKKKSSLDGISLQFEEKARKLNKKFTRKNEFYWDNFKEIGIKVKIASRVRFVGRDKRFRANGNSIACLVAQPFPDALTFSDSEKYHRVDPKYILEDLVKLEYDRIKKNKFGFGSLPNLRPLIREYLILAAKRGCLTCWYAKLDSVEQPIVFYTLTSEIEFAEHKWLDRHLASPRTGRWWRVPPMPPLKLIRIRRDTFISLHNKGLKSGNHLLVDLNWTIGSRGIRNGVGCILVNVECDSGWSAADVEIDKSKTPKVKKMKIGQFSSELRTLRSIVFEKITSFPQKKNFSHAYSAEQFWGNFEYYLLKSILKRKTQGNTNVKSILDGFSNSKSDLPIQTKKGESISSGAAWLKKEWNKTKRQNGSSRTSGIKPDRDSNAFVLEKSPAVRVLMPDGRPFEAFVATDWFFSFGSLVLKKTNCSSQQQLSADIRLVRSMKVLWDFHETE